MSTCMSTYSLVNIAETEEMNTFELKETTKQTITENRATIGSKEAVGPIEQTDHCTCILNSTNYTPSKML